jgi:hypothetical protein
MGRSYDVRLVALTIGATLKWVDNLLSQHELPGVMRGRQGVQRRITDEGLLAIELTRMLTIEARIPVGRATEIACAAIRSRSQADMQVRLADDLTFVFEASAIDRRLRQRLAEAIESSARVRRGRPATAARSDR